jgi:eukaryotic-like serine/threonine-protein kinase
VPETPVPPASLTGAVPPGYVLAGRYALVRLIARGGMADVWEAKDTLLERQVAVKILHPHLAADSAFVSRFRTEAIAAARLHHRSIVAIFDTCSDQGIEAIVMELARGHTLREEIDRHGPLDPVVVINIGVDVADALQSAHAAGLIHRDVKPANILLCDDQRVMVTDFGIAKVRDNSDRTQTGTMLGSVKYVSPEQVEGNPVDPRSDVYSLGVVLYEALTGRPPFVADTPAATALARLHSTPTHPAQLRPDAPRALTELIMRAMALEPAKRFATASDVRAALLAIRLDPRAAAANAPTSHAPRPGPRPAPTAGSLGSESVTVNASPPLPRAREDRPAPARRPPAQGRMGAIIVAAVLIVFALIVAVILITQSNPPGQGGEPGGTGPTATADPAGDDPDETDASPAPLVSLRAVQAFDPQGDDGGAEGRSWPDATDGDPGTAWVAQSYIDQNFGRTKDGVGIIVEAADTTEFARLEVNSVSYDWSAKVYVSDRNGATLADWGTPVANQEDIAKGDTTFELDGAKGRFVLLWITKLAAGPPSPYAGGNPFTIHINEITATGR